MVVLLGGGVGRGWYVRSTSTYCTSAKEKYMIGRLLRQAIMSTENCQEGQETTYFKRHALAKGEKCVVFAGSVVPMTQTTNSIMHQL